MIKYLAERTASYIVKNDSSADYEILAYGYDVLFQEIGVIILTLALAVPFGLFFHVAISLAAYNILRLYAGGVHAMHRVACITTSFIIMFGPAVLFCKLGMSVPLLAFPVLYIINLYLLLRYAPADTETKPIQEPHIRKRMKLISIVWLTVIYGVAVALLGRRPDYAAVLVIIPFIVCCFTHPSIYKMYGCKKSK